MEQNGKRHRYSDEDRANALAALAANGGNVNLTARQLGIPETTLRQWSKGQRRPEAAQMSEGKKEPLAERFEGIAYALLDHAGESLTDLNARDAIFSAAIAVDKMRLLREQPTAINKNDNAHSMSAELNEYLQAYREEMEPDTEATGSNGTAGS